MFQSKKHFKSSQIFEKCDFGVRLKAFLFKNHLNNNNNRNMCSITAWISRGALLCREWLLFLPCWPPPPPLLSPNSVFPLLSGFVVRVTAAPSRLFFVPVHIHQQRTTQSGSQLLLCGREQEAGGFFIKKKKGSAVALWMVYSVAAKKYFWFLSLNLLSCTWFYTRFH